MVIEQLKIKRSAILERWHNKILCTYSADTAAFLKRQKDPFANPVGQTLSREIEALFDELLEGMRPQEICEHLEPIIKIRSIQEFTPSQAISFVFFLKEAIREEFKKELRDGDVMRGLWEIEARIDQMVLFALDIYSRCREQLHELRVNEVKRRISGLMRRTNMFCDDLELVPEQPQDNQ